MQRQRHYKVENHNESSLTNTYDPPQEDYRFIENKLEKEMRIDSIERILCLHVHPLVMLIVNS